MKKRKKALLCVLLALVLLVLGTVCAAYGYYHSKIAMLQSDGPRSELTAEQEAELKSNSQELAEEMQIVIGDLNFANPIESTREMLEDDHILNILLIGTDERTSYFSDFARGDSCMLFSINTSGDAPLISLVSFERGMGVPILSGKYEGQWDWLTHTFAYGGAELMLEEIRQCFKIDVDYYVRVNFGSFIEGIDALGGVDVEFNETEAGYFNYHYNEYLFAAKTGVNHLNGNMALAFARLRKTDSDWYRIERQRKIIVAALSQLKSMNLLEIDRLIDDLLPLVRTNLTEDVITKLLLLAPSLPKATFQQLTIPQADTFGYMMGLQDRALFAVDFGINTDVLHAFLQGLPVSTVNYTSTLPKASGSSGSSAPAETEPETTEPAVADPVETESVETAPSEETVPTEETAPSEEIAPPETEPVTTESTETEAAQTEPPAAETEAPAAETPANQEETP